MLSVIIFIIILSILVLLHELGHFIVAKRGGIGVEEFGFGLPPRAWGKKIGGTIYSLNWLPFGGFVRLVGEDPTDKKRGAKNSFYNKSIGRRMAVVLAGVFMNFALAVVIFYVVVAALGFKVSLPLLTEHDFKFVNDTRQVLVVDVVPDSAAADSGLAPGDSIVRAQGTEIASTFDLQSVIRANEGKEVELVIENPIDNSIKETTVVPEFNEDLNSPAIGVSLGELAVLNYESLPQKIFAGFIHSYNTVVYSGKVLGQLVGFSVAQRDITAVSQGVSGPVGIANLTSQAVSLGPISVLQLVALLSLNLAIINILPIPALDGGRFFFMVVEVVTRRRVNEKFEKWAHTIGFALLIGLILLITYNDILKLLS